MGSNILSDIHNSFGNYTALFRLAWTETAYLIEFTTSSTNIAVHVTITSGRLFIILRLKRYLQGVINKF